MRWDELRDRHAGEVGLVLGNGPSLHNAPMSFLRGSVTLGSNRIYLLDGFNPTYYAAVNPLVIEQFVTDICQMECQAKFIGDHYARRIPDSLPLHSSSRREFSLTPNRWIYEGYTVTFVLLQIAYWLGFKRVLLFGVDHHYVYHGRPNEKYRLHGPDPNHFHPAYFSGYHWHNPDLVQAGQAYALARAAFEADGREIINCTPGSRLEVFERGDWRHYA